MEMSQKGEISEYLSILGSFEARAFFDICIQTTASETHFMKGCDQAGSGLSQWS